MAFAACAAPKPKSEAGGGHTWALLPLANGSNDVLAPAKVRGILFAEMTKRGYRLVPLERVDSALRGLGVSKGGQLSALDVDAIRRVLPADRLCYGTIIEYGFKSVLVLSQRKVELALRIVDAGSGKELHRDSQIGVNSSAGVDAAGQVVLNVAGKVVKSIKDSGKNFLPGRRAKRIADMTDIVADVDLSDETREAVRKLLKNLD